MMAAINLSLYYIWGTTLNNLLRNSVEYCCMSAVIHLVRKASEFQFSNFVVIMNLYKFSTIA